LTVTDVLVYSSNVGTVRIAKHLSEKDEEELVNLLGWNKKISNFPGATAGLIPNLKLPANRQYIAFGQGLALTPIHLVSSYAALITGYAPVPQIIQKVVREDGKVLYEFKPKYLNPDHPLFDNQTRAWLKETLHQIVLRGTGKKANPYYYGAGGKTGTAQIYDKKLHRYSNRELVTSFIGYFPYDNPQYILLVSVYKPKAKYRYLLYGGTVAAPYWREIVNEVGSYLGIKPNPEVRWLERKTRGAVKVGE
jgi:cell division protein FtsI/penicillin-binding protein 2